jgi:hypothetical protein
VGSVLGSGGSTGGIVGAGSSAGDGIGSADVDATTGAAAVGIGSTPPTDTGIDETTAAGASRAREFVLDAIKCQNIDPEWWVEWCGIGTGPGFSTGPAETPVRRANRSRLFPIELDLAELVRVGHCGYDVWRL